MFSGIDAFGHRAGVAYRGNNLNQHVDVTDRWATTAVYGGTTYDLAPGCCKADGTCFRKSPDCVAGKHSTFVPTNFAQADAACGMPRLNQSPDTERFQSRAAPAPSPWTDGAGTVERTAPDPWARLVRGRSA